MRASTTVSKEVRTRTLPLLLFLAYRVHHSQTARFRDHKETFTEHVGMYDVIKILPVWAAIILILAVRQ